MQEEEDGWRVSHESQSSFVCSILEERQSVEVEQDAAPKREQHQLNDDENRNLAFTNEYGFATQNHLTRTLSTMTC